MQDNYRNPLAHARRGLKIKQSPHGHFFMASSHCILHLCRLCVRPRLMRSRRHCHCKWPLAEEYQNNSISQISGKNSCMRKQTRHSFCHRAPPLTVKNAGYEARVAHITNYCVHLPYSTKLSRSKIFVYFTNWIAFVTKFFVKCAVA